MIPDDEAEEVQTLRRGKPQIVIIGGGFAGLNAAKALRRVEADVYLIDRENFHLFQPLLYQVATAGLGAESIASPIRAVLKRQKNIKVIHGEVQAVDREQRVVTFDTGRLEYDYLIVAAGMVTNYFGNEEWKRLAPGMKTLGDALECRRRILKVFERAEWSTDEATVESLLTFVIVGAGATGVELAGAIREIAHRVMAHDFRQIDSSKARVVLVDAGPRVLAAYDDDLSQRAREDLEGMGVEVRLNAMVDKITAQGVRIGDELIRSHTVIWAAGVKASPLGLSLDAELDRMGRVYVDEELTIPGDGRVFVVGDQAHLEGKDGEPLPGLAPVAIQQGRHVARNITQQLRGEKYEAFEYNDKGMMATLGRAKAIAQIGNKKFTGFFAWLMWLFVHLLFLIGFRNRLFVVIDWFYAYVGMRRAGRLILDTPDSRTQVQPRDHRLPNRIEVQTSQIDLTDEELEQGEKTIVNPDQSRRSRE